MSLWNWSKTASENDDSDSVSNISWAENQAPSTVNDSARNMMAELAKWRDDLTAVADSTGTGNAYEVAAASTVSAYVRGIAVVFKADRANTGAATLKLNGLAAVALKALPDRDLAAGEIQAGQIVAAYHDGTQFIMLNPGLGTVAIDKLEAGVVGRLASVGDIKPWFAETPPAGWLICDGSAVSRTTYSDLFAVWGTRFGAGDGSTTFNLIDLRGEFLRGVQGVRSIGGDPDATARLDRGDGTGGNVPGSKQGHATQDHDHANQLISNVGAGVSQSGFGSAPFTERQFNTAGNIKTGAGGLAAANVSNETRPTNVACHWIVLAKPSLASALLTLSGLSGFGFTFDASTTMANPGTGQVRIDGAETAIAINDQSSDAGNPDVGTAILTWDDSTSPVKGHVKISKANGPEIFKLYTLSGLTDNAGWTQLTVALVDSNGAFGDGDALRIDFARTGDVGSPGTQGPAGVDGGIRFAFDDGTDTSSDPGTGNLRFDNAAVASVTQLAVSDNSSDSGSPDVSAWVGAWGDSTNTTKGQLIVKKASAPQNFAIFDITGLTDQTGFTQAAASHVQSAGAFSDADDLSVQFYPAGDKGADGVGSVDQAFKTISVSGQSDIVAEVAEDTLILVDSGLLDITTNAGADTVSFDVPAASAAEAEAKSLATKAVPPSALGNFALVNAVQEYSKTQSFDGTVLTDGASISWNLDDNQVATVTLGGNRTLSNPSNMKNGATYILMVKQDATGSRTLSFGSNYKFPGGTVPTLSTGANAVDVLTFVSDGAAMFGVAQLDFS